MAAPRFSLRHALSLVAIIAFCLSIGTSIRQFRENRLLRQENTSLRNEVGKLTLEPGHEQQLHAIAIPSYEKLTWRWRIKVPDGMCSRVNTRVGDIPLIGFPKGLQGPELTGDCVLTVAVHQKKDKSWELFSHVENVESGGMKTSTSTTSNILPENTQWLEKTDGSFSASGVGNSTQVAVMNDPMQLLRSRFTPIGIQPKTGPRDGILVWLTEDKPASP
jgi:hypothetical protein